MKANFTLRFFIIWCLISLNNMSWGQTNDYPWPNSTYNTPNSAHYGMYYRNCTDWVAWKINQNQDNLPTNAPHAFFNNMFSQNSTGNCNPIGATQRLSNACRWANVLQSNGYFVTNTPTPGAIAHWSNTEIGNPNTSVGHVAYVEYVQSNGTPFLSHYNWVPGSGAYATTSNQNAPRYIRFNRFELIGSPNIQPISQGNSFNMNASIKNNHTTSVTTQIRASLYTSTNQFVGVLEEKTETFTAGQTKNLSFFKSSISSSPGEYKIWIETRVHTNTPFTLVHKYQSSSTINVNIGSASCPTPTVTQTSPTSGTNYTIGQNVSLQFAPNGNGCSITGREIEFIQPNGNSITINANGVTSHSFTATQELVGNWQWRVRVRTTTWSSFTPFRTFNITNNNCTLTLNRNPTAGGTVTGAGTHTCNTTRTVTATANTGYTFTNWTENGNVVSSNASYTFTLNGNRTLTANFAIVPQSCTLTLNRNPIAGGTVTGAGTHTCNTSRTVTATANTGYTFTNWTENGNVVSSNASYTFTLSGNRTLTANFAVVPQSCTLTLNRNPIAGGTVTGAGTHTCNTSRTITATANTGYTFTNWTENGNVVSSNASYTFTLNGNRTLTANFAIVPQSCTLTLNRNPIAGGTVTGAGTHTCNTSRTVTATANTGYTFTNWTENGNVVSSNVSYTFTLSGNRTLTANFSQNTTINIIGSINAVVHPTSVGNHILRCNSEKNISFSIRNVSSSTVTRSFKLYLTDMNNNFVAELWNIENVSILANETKNYSRNTHASLGSTVISPAGQYRIVLKGDTGTLNNITLNSPTVVCQSGSCNPQNIQIECPCTLTLNRNPVAGGSVTGAGTYVCGTTRTISATANAGYTFSHWSLNGANVSTNPSIQIPLNGNLTYVATFTLTLSIDENEILGNITVYPNPVSDDLFIESSIHAIQSIKLVDLNGRVIIDKAINSDKTLINLSNVQTALYLLKVQTDTGVQTIKIVKK